MDKIAVIIGGVLLYGAAIGLVLVWGVRRIMRQDRKEREQNASEHP